MPARVSAESLVVTRKPAKAICSSEAAFDDPPARQWNKALLAFGQFDDLQVDAFGAGRYTLPPRLRLYPSNQHANCSRSVRPEDNGAGLPLAPLCDPQHRVQVLPYGLKAARSKPALRLLIHRFPWRKVGRQQTPGRTHSGKPTQHVEQFAQFILPLRGASCSIRVRFGATKLHSSSATSLGYGLQLSILFDRATHQMCITRSGWI